jgi:hypothetical protein
MSKSATAVLVLTATATAAITASRFVTPAGAVAGAGANTLGVADSTVASGKTFPVVALGTATVEAGAAVSAGDTVKSDATGRAITWATSGAKVGIALEAAGAAGAFIEVALIPNAA